MKISRPVCHVGELAQEKITPAMTLTLAPEAFGETLLKASGASVSVIAGVIFSCASSPTLQTERLIFFYKIYNM
jgi:hypothetical protein